MNAREFRCLIYAFAIGDALGAPFEFETPTVEEINNRYSDCSVIGFTDDTCLLLTTLSAMSNSTVQEIGLWDTFYENTCMALHNWFLSGDFRGIGDTTYQALKQLDSHIYVNPDFSNFVLSDRGYNKDWSAGNGALSRSLPLLAGKVDISDIFLKKWVQITHWHSDALKSVELLNNYLNKNEIPPFSGNGEMKGFYCLEALEIAIMAVESANSLNEVFLKSIVPEGDNDSVPAIAFAIWYIKHGYNEFQSFESRISPDDKRKLDIDLRKSLFCVHERGQV